MNHQIIHYTVYKFTSTYDLFYQLFMKSYQKSVNLDICQKSLFSLYVKVTMIMITMVNWKFDPSPCKSVQSVHLSSISINSSITRTTQSRKQKSNSTPIVQNDQ